MEPASYSAVLAEIMPPYHIILSKKARYDFNLYAFYASKHFWVFQVNKLLINSKLVNLDRKKMDGPPTPIVEVAIQNFLILGAFQTILRITKSVMTIFSVNFTPFSFLNLSVLLWRIWQLRC